MPCHDFGKTNLMKWIRYFFSEFIPEVIVEMRKVSFPSKDEVVGTTIVVLISSFVFALYLWVADLIIIRVYEGLFNLTAKVLG